MTKEEDIQKALEIRKKKHGNTEASDEPDYSKESNESLSRRMRGNQIDRLEAELKRLKRISDGYEKMRLIDELEKKMKNVSELQGILIAKHKLQLAKIKKKGESTTN